MKKQLINKKEISHFLGNDCEEWINDFIYRLVNKKFTLSELRVEIKQMYKDYKKDRVEVR